jgi:MoaA/NifB/PqqE/SkfB family radical SAM enzyme
VESARWGEVDLSPAAWTAILPALPRVEHVHLQGWGEPLLHPDLPGMASAARAAGCTVGITTNGDLLDAATAWLLAVRPDLVTVSVAGGVERHEALRGGSRLAPVLAAAGDLAARAAERGRPRVQLSFLLTRDNAVDLEEVVRLSGSHGIRDVFVVHLDCTPSRELLELVAFSDSGLRAGVAEALAAARSTAARCGVRLRGPATMREDLLVCALDPTRFAYVSADGRVGPCTHLLLPVEGAVRRVDFAGLTAVEPVIYGSLRDASLAEALASTERQRFIAPFRARLSAEESFLASIGRGLGTTALAELEAADERRTRALAENPFPQACARCHKMAGW